MRYNDDTYIKNFIEHGIYPKIHDDIYSLDRYLDNSNVLDLGCCTGLLSRHLAETHNFVIGVDSEAKYIEKAIKHNNIQYIQMEINESTLEDFHKILVCNNIAIIYARRIIPEVYETGGKDLVNHLIQTMYDSKVEYLVVEGRKSNRNAVNPLKSIEEEVTALKQRYEVIRKYKNCAIMKRK